MSNDPRREPSDDREPWRTEGLEDYDGPPPVPIEVVAETLRPEDGWTVGYGVHFSFGGDGPNRIPVTIASHPEHGSQQWFPVAPSGYRRAGD